MGFSSDLPSVSCDLDELLIRIFEIQDDILRRRETLNTLLEYGFINMAKSRYSLGSKRIGMLQVNLGDHEALTRVCSTEGTSSIKDVRLTVYNIQNSDSRTEKEQTEIRQRNVASTNETKSEVPQTLDPIKWFGVLVPEALRNSQKEFKQALEAAVDLATLQNELTTLQTKYYELKKQKLSLKVQTSPVTNEEICKAATENTP